MENNPKTTLDGADYGAKSRPILFSASMVRAILDGCKTQTRRIVKDNHLRRLGLERDGDFVYTTDGPQWNGTFEGDIVPWSPYGRPGDLLWVRETWGAVPAPGPVDRPKIRIGPSGKGVTWLADWRGNPSGFKWKPSIHMPRWASRVTLKILNVRVERLQCLSESDAIAEGVRQVTKDGKVFKYCVYDSFDMSTVPWSEMPRNAVDAFKLYLGGLGHLDWNANPWVWVVEFERVESDAC